MTTPISYSLRGAADASGLSTSALDRAIKSGRLRAKKSSVDQEGNPVGVWLITHEALKSYVDSLVDA